MENLSQQQNATNIMSYKDWAVTIFLASLPIIDFSTHLGF